MNRIIFHVDVNNAFLSWEAVYLLNNNFKLDIRKIPSVIGGDESKRHGIVLAKSEPAKKLGIVTAETLYSARKKCSNLKIYSPHYDIYEQESLNLYNFLLNYSPKVERFSIDECYVDYTGMENLLGDPVTVAYEIKDKIKEVYGWTVNVGIGNNKLCAKMASDFSKPDKVHTLFKNEIETKLWPLDVNDLYMAGKKTSIKLKELGINTIGDLAHYNFLKLKVLFKKQSYVLRDYALGIDESIVNHEKYENKGISVSTTTPKDLETKQEIKELLFSLVEDISSKLRKDNLYPSTIAITLRNNLFITYSHQKKLFNSSNTTKDLYKEVCFLLDNIYKEESIRHVGIRVTDFTNNSQQLSLFESIEVKEINVKLDNTLDKLKDKYGNNIISYAISKKNK